MVLKFFKFILSIIIWIFFWLIGLLTIALLIAISLIVPKRFYNKLVQLTCKIMISSVLIFPRKKGLADDKIPFPCIYVANHVSFFDLFISGSTLPGYPRGLELKSHFSTPIYGWFITKFGEIPIDPANKTSIKESFIHIETVLKNKERSILIMPEGKRTRTGKIENFKYGAFYLSRISNIPVVPVVYKGLFKKNNPTSLLINPGIFDVIIIDPISPENFNSDEEMAFAVRKLMIDKLEEPD